MPAVAVPGLRQVQLAGGFWGRFSELHRTAALDHQWRMLAETGSLEAFGIASGAVDGFRACATGVPFSDSDVHKWVDAASRAMAGPRPPELEHRLADVVRSIDLAQAPDGYLNTWIQTLFPGGRFRDLVLEHELYCLGHLIEAGVSHHEATGERVLLEVAVRAADLLVREFRDAPAHRVDGHQEIELALVRLHRATGDPAHLDLARRFIDRRGTARHPARRFVAGFVLLATRDLRRRGRERAYRRRHPGWTSPVLRDDDHFAPTRALVARFVRDSCSGVYFQTARPARGLTEPSGHAVRFGYQQVALAMLARELGDAELRRTTAEAWDRLVDAHLSVSGGAGALAIIEAFDEPYRLDPDVAYNETCAAIAGILWSRELGLLTGEPGPDDLLEWQLLNGAAVGMGVDGASFTYDNPLRVAPGVARRSWFLVPCCPSNLSRTWASLGTLQFSRVDDELRIHQLFSSRAAFGGATVEVDSELPWAGEVVVRVAPAEDGPSPRRVAIRIPSWAADATITLDGATLDGVVPDRPAARPTASGVDPRRARWCRIDLPDGPCEIRVELPLEIRLLEQDPRIPKVGGSVAVARGPLLYCLEGVDHPGLDQLALSDLVLDPAGLEASFDPDLLGGAVDIAGRTADGRPLRFVPYFLWGNRGAGGMTTFIRCR